MAATTHLVVELTHADGTRTEVVLDRAIEIGRDAEVRITDPQASRRHAVLRPTTGGVELEDLGSTNGTFVDGERLTGPRLLGPGTVATIGGCRIRVRSTAPVATPAPAPVRPAAAPHAATNGAAGLVEVAAREVRLLADHGAYAASYTARVAERLDAAARAMDRLRRAGNDAVPTVRLVGAFTGDDGTEVRDGFRVDAEHATIDLALGDPGADDAIARSLAAFYAATLPAASELAALVDGYALVRTGAALDDHVIRGGVALRPIAETTGRQRTMMAGAFATYLLAEHDEANVVTLLVTARPGAVDRASIDALGAPLGALEARWLATLADDVPQTTVRDFLRQAAGYFRPHKRTQAEIFALALLSLVFTVVFAKVTQRLFNNVLRPDLDTGGFAGDFGDAAPLLGILGGGLVITLAANLRQSLVSARLSADITNDVRTRMFSLLQDLSLGWHQRRDRGDLMSRFLSDVGTFEQGVSSVIREGALQVVTLLVNAVLLLQLDVKLGLLTLVGAPIAVLVYRSMGEQAQRRSLVTEQRKAAVGNVVSENLDAQAVVKAYSLEDRERSRFGAVSDRLRTADIRLNFFSGLFGVSVGLVINLLRIAIMSLGVWLILRGDMKLGTFIAFNGVVGEVISPMAQLADLGRTAQTSTGALARIEEILGTQPDVRDEPHARPLTAVRGEIGLDHVGFRYRADRAVLDDVTITAPAGARVALVGPSGAGKSSVLALLQRNWDPGTGRVLLDGVDLRDITLASLRDAIGVVQQETFLFDGTIRENIALARPGATDAEIREAALMAGLRDLVESTRGLDTAVGERGSQLSVGQRQRVAIARVLLRRPKVLLLDEATSALDPVTERDVVEALRVASEGRTTVAVTHRLHTVQDYDHLVVLAEGRVVEQGTHDELLAAGGHYATMWHEQQRADQAPAGNPAIDATAHDVLLKLPPEFAEFLAGSARRVELHPGDRRREGGWLGVVIAGQATVEVQGPDGRPMAMPAGAGAVFGVRSLLGEDRGSVLVATAPLTLLEVGRHELRRLDPEVLRVLAAGPKAPRPEGAPKPA